jgi:hypothetical protein
MESDGGEHSIEYIAKVISNSNDTRNNGNLKIGIADLNSCSNDDDHYLSNTDDNSIWSCYKNQERKSSSDNKLSILLKNKKDKKKSELPPLGKVGVGMVAISDNNHSGILLTSNLLTPIGVSSRSTTPVSGMFLFMYMYAYANIHVYI